jgi:cell division septation protein DedD
MKEAQPAPTASDAAVKETQAAAPKKPEPAIPSATETKPKDLASVQTPGKTAKPPGTEVSAPAAPSAASPDKQKPAPSGGRAMYAVQIATLKDKQGAEELKKTLQKKGFDVIMKTTNDPKQGQIYSLQLQPVDNMGKASTLMEQVKYVPQAKPSIVTIPPGN